VIIIAGPNGAGKTTFGREFLRPLLKRAPTDEQRTGIKAAETKTPLVIVRDGVLVKEYVTDLEASLRELDEYEELPPSCRWLYKSGG
jgi:hypothetical protein